MVRHYNGNVPMPKYTPLSNMDFKNKKACENFYAELRKGDCWADGICAKNVNNKNFLKSQLKNIKDIHKSYPNWNSTSLGNLGFIVAYCDNETYKRLAYKTFTDYAEYHTPLLKNLFAVTLCSVLISTLCASTFYKLVYV